MNSERDSEGRLRVPYFVQVLKEYLRGKETYVAREFKRHIEELGVLAPADWGTEANGYLKWMHRVDRAAQKVLTDI